MLLSKIILIAKPISAIEDLESIAKLLIARGCAYRESTAVLSRDPGSYSVNVVLSVSSLLAFC